MLTKWARAFILIVINPVFIEATSPWTHYEKIYTGGCISRDNSKPCADLGEHAYKGHLLDRPPKGAKFYLDDLEEVDDDFLPFDRKKRSSKRKENKNIENVSTIKKEDDEEEEEEENEDEADDDDIEGEEKVEKPVKKGSERKKGNNKEKEENVEKEYGEDDEEEEANDEGNEDVETEEKNEKEVLRKSKIKE